MNILVDENIPRMSVCTLKDKGYDVKDIRGTVEDWVLRIRTFGKLYVMKHGYSLQRTKDLLSISTKNIQES